MTKTAEPSPRQRTALALLLRASERRCSAAMLATLARRGWVAPGPGGAYRLTAAGRALAESLESESPSAVGSWRR